MSVGGYNGDYVDTVDLISLNPVNYPVPQCLRTRNPFVRTVGSASGAALIGRKIPHVCGGDGISEYCYEYDSMSDSW